MILEETEEGEGSIVVDVWFLFYSILRLLTSPSFLVIAMNLLIV